MRFAALATDYDGTLANEGIVHPAVIEALRRFRASGRRIILLTGRTFASLVQVFPHTDEFDLIVAENGATLYSPVTRSEKTLADAPPRRFLEALEARGVSPLEVGRVIVATSEKERQNVIDVIQEEGLELHIVFNKGSLMVLPGGTNKATGLRTALDALRLSCHNIAGIGDAENDNAFLAVCEFSSAVSNAQPSIKERVHLVTGHANGSGVMQVIDCVLANDLRNHSAWLGRPIAIGRRDDGEEVKIEPCAITLVAGPSGGGKSKLMNAFLEGLIACKYQFCALDPEGDYDLSGQTSILGKHHTLPAVSEVLEVMDRPEESVVVNLLNIELEKRPAFFNTLLEKLLELRKRTGRPHCIIADEAHHLVTADQAPENFEAPSDLSGLVLITVRPEHLPRAWIQNVHNFLAAGDNPEDTIRAYCEHVGVPPPRRMPPAQRGQMLAWRPGSEAAFVFSPPEPQTARARHRRKYAEGELGPERSFYFRGPEGKLNLRAFNLISFLQLMDGVDNETWLFHLKNREYSSWFRREIKDEAMARDAEQIERSEGISADESRARFRSIITSRYTLPV